MFTCLICDYEKKHYSNSLDSLKPFYDGFAAIWWPSLVESVSLTRPHGKEWFWSFSSASPCGRAYVTLHTVFKGLTPLLQIQLQNVDTRENGTINSTHQNNKIVVFFSLFITLSGKIRHIDTLRRPLFSSDCISRLVNNHVESYQIVQQQWSCAFKISTSATTPRAQGKQPWCQSILNDAPRH